MNKQQSITLLGMLTITSATFAQPIPAPVKASLAMLYPAATQVKWDKEDRDYEASFKNKGRSMSLLIDAKGMLKETETVIATNELPVTIREYVARQLPGKKISEAAIIVNAAGTRMYEAEINGKDYMFDTAGKRLKK